MHTDGHRSCGRSLGWLLAGVWLVMFLGAILVDRPVAIWVHQSEMDRTMRVALGGWLAFALKSPGTFYFAVAIAVIGALILKLKPSQVWFVILASVFSGINALVKWIVGRTRPFKLPGSIQPQPFHFEPFWHGWHGLFHQRDLCFPSGHACASFALFTAIVLVLPRWSALFGVLAVLVAAERVLENAHYCSDAIGGIGLGAAGTLLVWKLMICSTGVSPVPNDLRHGRDARAT